MKSIFLFLFLSCQFLANGQDKAYIRKLILDVQSDIAFKENKVFKLISLDVEAEEATPEQKKIMNRTEGTYIVRYQIKGYTIENNTKFRHNITGRYFIIFTHKYELLKIDTY